MKHKFLKTASNLLIDYYTEFKDDNILEVCVSKESLPFAIIVTDPNFPDTLLLSFAADLSEPLKAAVVTLVLSRIANTELTEGFYIDSEYEYHWGEEAYEVMAKDNKPTIEEYQNNELMKMPAISSAKN